MLKNMIKITIKVPKLLTKQRPRFNRKSGHAYHTKQYTDYLESLSNTLKKLSKVKNKDSLAKPFCLGYVLHVKNPDVCLRDIDNTIGAIQDGLVQAKVGLKDDAIKHLRKSFQSVRKHTEPGEKFELIFFKNFTEFIEYLVKYENDNQEMIKLEDIFK